MKKSIILAVAILAIMLSGCAPKTEKVEKNNSNSRMIVIDETLSYRIYADKQTKVMYLCTKSGYGESLCVMVDEEGYPLLWEGEDAHVIPT